MKIPPKLLTKTPYDCLLGRVVAFYGTGQITGFRFGRVVRIKATQKGGLTMVRVRTAGANAEGKGKWKGPAMNVTPRELSKTALSGVYFRKQFIPLSEWVAKKGGTPCAAATDSPVTKSKASTPVTKTPRRAAAPAAKSGTRTASAAAAGTKTGSSSTAKSGSSSTSKTTTAAKRTASKTSPAKKRAAK